MTLISGALVRLAGRIVPSSSDEVVKIIRPASAKLYRQALDELGLAMVWAGAMIVGLLLLLAVAAAAHQVGGVAERGANLIWLAYGWFTFAGLCLHGTRFLLADQTTRRLESAYVRRHANRSSKDAALGSEVKDASPSVVLRLTRSTDWDLVLQAVIALLLTVATR